MQVGIEEGFWPVKMRWNFQILARERQLVSDWSSHRDRAPDLLEFPWTETPMWRGNRVRDVIENLKMVHSTRNSPLVLIFGVIENLKMV